MDAKQLGLLKEFVGILKAKPEILHMPELSFFADWIRSMGGTVPPKPTSNGSASAESAKPTPEAPKAEPTVEDVGDDDAESAESADEPEVVESDLDDDKEGVIETPDVLDDSDVEVDLTKEVSEEDMERGMDLRGKAQEALSEGKLADALKLFTEAITAHPSASLLAKRAAVYVKLSQPNHAVRDCDKAISVNQDSAAPYKWRGRARMLLGRWSDAAKDLRMCCKLDFDETANDWLKEISSKAKRVEDHNRKYENLREERRYKQLLKEKKRRTKAYEKQKKADAERASRMGGGMGGMPGMGGMGGMPGMGGMGGAGGGMGGMGGMFSDPEMMGMMQDPEVMAAFSDIMKNPQNIAKYAGNPKVMKVMQKMQSSMGGMAGGMGGGGGAGGMPDMSEMFGGAPDAGAGGGGTAGNFDID